MIKNFRKGYTKIPKKRVNKNIEELLKNKDMNRIQSPALGNFATIPQVRMPQAMVSQAMVPPTMIGCMNISTLEESSQKMLTKFKHRQLDLYKKAIEYYNCLSDTFEIHKLWIKKYDEIYFELYANKNSSIIFDLTPFWEIQRCLEINENISHVMQHIRTSDYKSTWSKPVKKKSTKEKLIKNESKPLVRIGQYYKLVKDSGNHGLAMGVGRCYKLLSYDMTQRCPFEFSSDNGEKISHRVTLKTFCDNMILVEDLEDLVTVGVKC